ncbi:MAG: GSCFA domain-containing protein [Paludibacteraceae bacterium]|nr:GSCFA domain-containing protein [Paludibacteraceae bacterium]
MQFTTQVNIAHSAREITYSDRILLLGSCFSENISQKFKEAYFRVSSNPFGVLYNPLSIARCLDILLCDSFNFQLSTFNYNGLWHSMLHHGDFSRADRQEFDAAVRQSIADGRRALSESSVVIVTFGTAWVYEMDGEIVGNCHKLPHNMFTRRRLSVEEIVGCWQKLLQREELRDKHFIFTVSPIRHLKDGLHENQLSKATLLLATEKLVMNEDILSAEYFPSYEIVTDELRDYRFYADDMLHPSAVAVEYIWQRFMDTFLSNATKQDMVPLTQLYSDLHHRPLHPDSEEYIRFLQKTKEKARALRKKYPWIEI